MTYLMSAILGLVQGVAEFLPISSSGHLTLLQHFFGMEEPDQLFNILLHFATLLAVCIYYFQDVLGMILEFFRGIAAMFSRQPGQGEPPETRRLVFLVIVGTLPLFLILPVKKYVEGLGSSPVFVSFALLVTGCILFFSDRMASGRKTARSATVKDVLLVGAAQGIATIPGLSRSGCTISAGMALGFRREFAVRYSFLMSSARRVRRHPAGGEGHPQRRIRYPRRDAAQVSAGHGHRRCGGLFRHPPGEPAGRQGQVRRLRLLLLDRGRHLPGALPAGGHLCPRLSFSDPPLP